VVYPRPPLRTDATQSRPYLRQKREAGTGERKGYPLFANRYPPNPNRYPLSIPYGCTRCCPYPMHNPYTLYSILHVLP